MTATITDPAHVVTVPTPDPGAEPRRWSHSAVEKAIACPLQWGYRHGPLRTQAPTPPPASTGGDMARLRGILIHDALAAALRAARDDDHHTAPTRVGAPMLRYWDTAFAALGTAWEHHAMPSIPAEAEQLVDMLRYALTVTPIPHPARVFTIEDERDWHTPAGRPLRFVVDYATWLPSGRLSLVDWKTGRDDPDEVGRNRQMLRYGLWVAESAGIDPALIDLELVNVRTRRSKRVPLDVARARRAVARIDAVADVVENAATLAATPGPHCTMCDARATCPVAFGAPR